MVLSAKQKSWAAVLFIFFFFKVVSDGAASDSKQDYT